MPHFGVHCFAITRNLLQIRYHDDSAFIKVAQKALYKRFETKLLRRRSVECTLSILQKYILDICKTSILGIPYYCNSRKKGVKSFSNLFVKNHLLTLNYNI